MDQQWMDSKRASPAQIEIFQKINERLLKKQVKTKPPSFWPQKTM